VTEDDYLLAAIEIAWQARRNGNHPFGALLVDPAGTIVSRAQNTVVTGRDATGHAETNLARLASAGFDRPVLRDYTLYTSTEPCAMCAGAIYWAGIGRVSYALAEHTLLEYTGANPANPTMRIPCRTVFAAGQETILVTGPTTTLDAAARAVHEGFWS
jgi:tRNA(Arg) A34 adenosine deaminase TadA